MTIQNKILTGFTILFGIGLFQGAVEYRRAKDALSDVRQLRLGALPESVAANRLYEATIDLELNLILPPTDQSSVALLDGLATFSASLEEARRATTAARIFERGSGKEANVGPAVAEGQSLHRLTAAFAPIAADLTSRLSSNPSPNEYQRLATLMRQDLDQQVRPLVVKYRDEALVGLLDYTKTVEERAQTARKFLLISGMLAVAFALFACLWLTRTIMRPITQAVDAVNAIGAGDSARRLDVSDHDEFSTLAESFNDLLGQQANAALALSEASKLAADRAKELDNFIELSMDILAVASPEGHFTRVNTAFIKLVGYSADEITSRPWLDFVHPDDQEQTKAAGSLLMAGEPVCNFENRYRSRDGSWKWISWQVSPDTSSAQFFAVGRDVTAKRAADRDLRESRKKLKALNENLEELVAQRTSKLIESEQRFRTLVDGVKDYAIIALDSDGRIVSWNPGAARIKGYEASEIIGRNISTFYRPQDVAAGKPARALAQAREEGRCEETGWRLGKGGHEFFADVLITAVHDNAGTLQGFAKITRDITAQHQTVQALKQQEEMLRLLMEHLAEGVVACDAEGQLTFFNKAARQWHGGDAEGKSPDSWTGTFDLFEADGTTPLSPERVPLFRANHGERVRGVEMVIARPSEPPRVIEASGDALLTESGRRLGAVVVMRDVTARRRAERDNLRTQRLESIGTLAGGIAHDLNNALAPVLMGIELLKMRYPGPHNMLDTMETSSRRGASMVRQLLTFAKGVDGERVLLDPTYLIREIKNLIESTFPKNITLEVSCDAHAGKVLGDSTQLHQVLLNLCVNARDAMPDGGTLTISTEQREIDALYASSVPGLEPGRYLCLQVQDTGTGIPPDVIERIFEPFFSTKAPDAGTGLGLSSVIGIIRSHGGNVQVYSPAESASKGTRFSVYLPTANSDGAATVAPFAPVVDFAGNGRSVLVIEDEPAIRETFEAVLTHLNFKVVMANDGVEGLQQLIDRQGQISLIITDLHMPNMDGLNFVRKAREALPDVPIIVASGRVDKEAADQLSTWGVRALLNKPFTQGALVEGLQQVFRSGSYHPFRSSSGTS